MSVPPLPQTPQTEDDWIDLVKHLYKSINDQESMIRMLNRQISRLQKEIDKGGKNYEPL